MYALILLLLLLSSCSPWVIGGQMPPGVPETPAPAPAQVAPPPPSPPEPVAAVVWPEPPVRPVVYTPPPEPPPVPVVKEKGPSRLTKRSTAEPTPEQLIQEAQQSARVAPTREGYFGGSGIQRYLYVPGKIYDVYLAPGTGTKLELPPGEVLAHALVLNPKSFDVSTATVGNEVSAKSIILIRPCAQAEEGCVASPPVDVALTSATGRGYNLHLIVGKVGMLGATWELVPMVNIEVAEPGMLPRGQR